MGTKKAKPEAVTYTSLSLKEQVDAVIGPEAWEQLRAELEAIIVTVELEDTTKPFKEVQDLVKDALLDPLQKVLHFVENTQEAQNLFHSWVDVLAYETPLQQAADDNEADLADLTWLVAARPPEGEDKDDYVVGEALRELRETGSDEGPGDLGEEEDEKEELEGEDDDEAEEEDEADDADGEDETDDADEEDEAADDEEELADEEAEEDEEEAAETPKAKRA